MLAAKAPNATQIQFWNETAGEKWVTLQKAIIAQDRLFGLLAMERAAVMSGERILDVGCGCGGTSVELAGRVGTTRESTGIDLSSIMLARAREMAKEYGEIQVRFINADAQTYAFQPQSIDLLYSRFGIIFFSDLLRAFENLFRALCPGGRFFIRVPARVQKNLWALVPTDAVGRHLEIPPSRPDAPGPFVFANPDHLVRVFSEVGIHQIAVERSIKDVPLGAGGDLEAAVDFLLQMGPAAAAVRQARQPEKQGVLTRALLDALAPHHSPQGVHMQAAAGIVTGCWPS